MPYVHKDCSGCGGPKPRGAGIRYCADCKTHMAQLALSQPKSRAIPTIKRCNDPRTLAMSARYRSGETLAEIGASYGLTRERVRQLISVLGDTGKTGGAHVFHEHNALIAERKAAAKMRVKMAKFWPAFGCTYGAIVELNNGCRPHAKRTLATAYFHQRRSAARRDIAWEMTFPEWVDIWKRSGFLSERGIGRNKYCMARFGDVGPYSAGNVYITTCSENVKAYRAALKTRGVVCPDGWVRLPEKANKNDGKPRRYAAPKKAIKARDSNSMRGWRYRPDQSSVNPYQASYRNKHLGSFPTPEAAYSAYAIAKATSHAK